MEKEEILRRSRSEKNDELEKQVWNMSMRWTYLAMVVSAAVFSYIRDMNGQPMMDLCATVCISVCAGRAYCYAKTKESFHLIMALVIFAIAIFATIRFFMGH